MLKPDAVSPAARDLVFFIEHTQELYFGHLQPAVDILKDEARAGRYDREQALTLFADVAQAGMKAYSQEGMSWTDPEKVRREAAWLLELRNRRAVLDWLPLGIPDRDVEVW